EPVITASSRTWRRLALVALVATPSAVLPAQAAPSASTNASAATDTVALTLDDALRAVLGRRQEARRARSEIGIAEQQVRSARSAALPNISGAINYTRTFDTPFRGAGISLPDSMRFEPDTTASIADRVRYLERNAGNAGLAGFGA